MDPFTIGILILAGVVAIGSIIWYAVWGKEEPDIDVGDATLLAMGMEDPSLAVSAYTTGCACGEDCDCGGDDLDVDDTMELPTELLGTLAGAASNVETSPSAPDEPFLGDVGSKSNVDTGEVWTHIETPEPAPVSHSTWSHEDYGSSSSSSDSSSSHSSSSSSYDSGSSSSSDSGGGGCGGD
jgi:hypothetical protein